MRGLLSDALGSASESIDLTNLLHRMNDRPQSDKKPEVDPTYFASKSPHGPIRLREHLQENAFWGKCLYGASAKQAIRNLAIYFVAIIIATFLAIPFASNDDQLITARILVALTVFGATITQINEIIAWRSAESKIELVDRRLNALEIYSEVQLRGDAAEALYAVFGDYSVATALTPPVPRKLYLRERDSLNALWKRRSPHLQTSQQEEPA
ncbi:hypothetical protein [Acrocarpospora catenulata]|uniref:hypothetical protein n=1 Tax=Acrocarpospora catenulata TaxID=2836182 RepID=UPI001BDA5424|nr:hypothetical protein [Acrocarpospora catenulata]